MKEETKQMGLMKKLTSALVASSLVFSLVGTAAAAYTPAAGETAAKRMQDLKLVAGRPDGSLGLNDSITRAELVTVIVRAFGQEENAKFLKGSTAFTDISTHWASGNIAMAAALAERAGGDKIGFENGSFQPDAKLTPAQAVAFLMKFVGVKADAAKAWPANYLDVAVEKNIITAEDKALIAPMLNENATRGLVFYMFDRAFANYTLATGKTFYTQYVDTMAPVITLNTVEPTTNDSKVTISGNVKDATEVYVGTTKVTADATGNFSVAYDLPELKEYNITVTARDLAGNTAEKATKVSRVVGTAAAIEASDITVAAGATVEVKATVKDAKGNTVTAAITGESTVGTFADGKFTAGKAAGNGTLTLKVGEITKEVKVTVNAGALAKVEADKTSVAPGAIVTLTAKDEFGNVINGVTYTQSSANAMLDGVNGKFMASAAGSYTVTAKAGDVTKDITIGVFSTSLSKFQVTAATSLVANNATGMDITINAVDANGNVIANYGNDSTQKFYMTGDSFEYYTADTDTWAAFPVGGFTITKGTKTLKIRTVAGVVGGQVVSLKASSDAAGTLNKHTASIELIEQVATGITVTMGDTYLPNNTGTETSTATVKVVDQAGQPMLGGAYAVKVSVTGPAAIHSDDSPASDGTKTKTFIGGNAAPTFKLVSKRAQAGEVVVTATATGLTTGTGKLTATTAGAVSKFVSTLKTESTGKANGASVLAFKVSATDVNGVPVKAALPAGALPTVVADISDDYADQIEIATSSTYYTLSADLAALSWKTLSDTDKEKSIALDTTAGFNSLNTTYVYVKANGYTGALNLTVKDKAASGALDSVAQGFTFGADKYARFGMTGSVKVAAASPTGALTVQMYDDSDNKVAAADVELTVKVYSDAGLSTQVTDTVVNGTTVGTNGLKVKTDANGVATLNVTVPGYVGYARYFKIAGVQADGTTALTKKADGVQDYVSGSLTVTNFLANSMTTAITATNSAAAQISVDAGTTVRVRATVKDVNGNNVGNGETVKLYVTEGKAQSDVSGTWTKITTDGISPTGYDTTDGYYYFDVKPYSAGRVSFQVKDTTYATAVTGTAAIGTRALAVTDANNTAKAFKVVVSGGSTDSAAPTTIAKNTPTALTLTFTDYYGNAVVAPNDVAVTIGAFDVVGGVDTADTNVAFRSSETGLNTTSITISAGSSTATVYVVAGSSADSFKIKTSATTKDRAAVDITLAGQTFFYTEK